jgi:hypothetical protein
MVNSEDFIAANNAIADAVREGDWNTLFKKLEEWPCLSLNQGSAALH